VAFAMKMAYSDLVLPENSLKNIFVDGKKAGFQFDLRLNYYRGQYLSVIDSFAVVIDGKEVPEKSIRFCLNGKEFGICQLEHCYTEFWNILTPAVVKVLSPGGLAAGEHKVEVSLFFRSPYMPIGPDHQYMPVDGSGSRVFILKEGESWQ